MQTFINKFHQNVWYKKKQYNLSANSSRLLDTTFYTPLLVYLPLYLHFYQHVLPIVLHKNKQ